jgi:hypothetical protein
MLQVNLDLQHFFITHLFSILFFTIIYYYLFNDIEENFILNNKITKEEYLKNKLLNSFFLSVNMETTTGYVDFYVKSPLAKIICLSQLFLSLLITTGFIHIIKN